MVVATVVRRRVIEGSASLSAQARLMSRAQVRAATPTEGRRMLENQAIQQLNISGDEFLRRWDAGQYRQLTDCDLANKVDRVRALIPFVRPNQP